ncbi:15085_t:CDS:2, partial [Racocetra persica]
EKVISKSLAINSGNTTTNLSFGSELSIISLNCHPEEVNSESLAINSRGNTATNQLFGSEPSVISLNCHP